MVCPGSEMHPEMRSAPSPSCGSAGVSVCEAEGHLSAFFVFAIKRSFFGVIFTRLSV